MPKLPRKTYSETFKLEVLCDYYASGMSMIATVKKWGLTSHSDIFRWLKCYPIDSDLLSLPSELLAELSMRNEPKSKEQILEEELFRLKKNVGT